MPRRVRPPRIPNVGDEVIESFDLHDLKRSHYTEVVHKEQRRMRSRVQVDASAREQLRRIVGETRLNCEHQERRLYSFDTSTLPPLARLVAPTGIAGGVVRPASEDDLQQVVCYAAKRGLKLVPRAAATSGYGGVLPTKDALVVAMDAFDRTLSVNIKEQTVTCQAGAVWEEVDRELAKEGLTLRLYPSSYPASTVGGWLAQGGVGFGSFEYGRFKDNVVSARVVLPNGFIRLFEGDELLDLIADAEGITGFITEVTLRLRPVAKQKVALIAFANSEQLGAAVTAVREKELPLWSLWFCNPDAVRYSKALPLRRCHAFESEDLITRQQMLAELPEEYLMLVAYPSARISGVDEPLAALVEENGGRYLPRKLALAEWDGRTAPMRLKRTAPTLIPTEVTVPVEKLDVALARLSKRLGKSLVLEGMGCKDGSVALLGFLPHDQQRVGFSMAYVLSLSASKIAKRLGGDAYATGLYLRNKTRRLFGKERLGQIKDFKASYDPRYIMNPGKVIRVPRAGGRPFGFLRGLVSLLEPLLRPLARLCAAHFAVPRTAEQTALRETKAAKRVRHGVPGDVALRARICARCGYCVRSCEQFSGRGWESQSPRGKYALLSDIYAGKEVWNRTSAETILLCTTCERCNLRCQLELPVEHDWMQLRGGFSGGGGAGAGAGEGAGGTGKRQKPGAFAARGIGTFPPFEMMAASLRGEGDIWAGKREHRADWVPDDVRKQLVSPTPHTPQTPSAHQSAANRTPSTDHSAANRTPSADLLFFAGCTASYVETDIAEATVRLLLESGHRVAYLGTDEGCCGIPMKMAGKWDLFGELFEHNYQQAMALVEEQGVRTIVTSCPACALVWRELYAEEAAARGWPYDFEVRHYTELLAPAVADGRLALKKNPFKRQTVTFHDACHLGRAQGLYEEPRDLLTAIPNIKYVEMEHNREEGLCCGSVLTLVGDIDTAPVLGAARLAEALDAGAGTVIALCPCCQVQLRDAARKNDLPLVIDDLARVVAVAAGFDIPSAEPQTTFMWSLFDTFIRLMKPAQMAAFMERLFPQMLAAMPLGMGALMPLMVRLPGGTTLVREMMPSLFPLLAPGILKKIMPSMTGEVSAHLGEMPPDMEALLPELLPQTLDALMRPYIPQLTPHLVPRFIDFLKKKKLTRQRPDWRTASEQPLEVAAEAATEAEAAAEAEAAVEVEAALAAETTPSAPANEIVDGEGEKPEEQVD